MNLIEFNSFDLWYAAFIIAVIPFTWNIVARLEYRTHFLTNICGGAYRGCYFLAVLIFCASSYRYHV